MPELPPTESPTVAAIYAAYVARTEKPRRYLGASVIGRPCERALWYDFRWCGAEKFSGRMLRLFETGQREESRFVANLRAIGCTVHEVDESTGQQWAMSAIGGHFRGHADGVALGLPEAPKTWHLLEFKTHSAKSFASLKSKGVAVAKPEHAAQMQTYMAALGLERALYMAVNKDTDELYAERLKADPVEAERLHAKARRIISAAEPPPRITDDPDDFRCRFCSHRELCHRTDPAGPAVPSGVNCRTCCHSTPVIDDGAAGAWKCERFGCALGEAEQEAGCADHLFVPAIVGDSIEDAGPDDNRITYITVNGDRYTNGQQPGDFRSDELAEISYAGITTPIVNEIKNSLGGVVVRDEDIPF